MHSYSDNLLDLLEEIGPNLTELEMYAVDQIDMKALAMITIYCINIGSEASPFDNILPSPAQ